MSKILKSLDLFPAPFFFNLQNNEQKRKTAIGGVISLTVFLLSLSYFTYICYLYFNNKIDPTVNQSQKVLKENFFMTIQNNILAFQVFLPNGQTLEQFQHEKGLTYILPTVSYKYPDPNDSNQTKSTSINLIQCTDPDLESFYCFDFSPISNMQNQMDMGYDAAFLGRYMFEMSIIICDTNVFGTSLNCASEQQFRQDFLRIATNFLVKITTQYYNTQNKQFEKFTRNQLVQMSDGLTSVFQINLQRTSQQITSGFLFQQKQYNTFFSDFSIRDIYFTKEFIFEEYGRTFNLLNVFQFQIGNVEVQQKIQYPLFTYVLAQFASVFNVLLILGIIGQLFSQNQLILDFAEIQLKSYFKASAYNILKQINLKKMKVEDSSLSKRLANIYFKIKNKSFLPYFNNYLNINLFKRLKILIMARFFDQQMGEKDSSQIKLFKELINETQKQLSINELQKELMQMKIILRLLLSTEQFAALQLCGYFINSEKQLTPSEINPVKQSQRMQDIQNQVKISNKESERNQIEENQNIIESCQQNSEKKYNQIENMNKCILSNENIVDDTNQKDSQNSKIQSLIQKNMTFRIDDNDFSQNVQLNENVFQKNPQNHLDSIYKVENNIHYFEQSISRFLDSKYSKSELDKRILSCMIGFDEKELG